MTLSHRNLCTVTDIAILMRDEVRDSQGRKVVPGDWIEVRAGNQVAVGLVVAVRPPDFVRVRIAGGQHIYCWPHEFGLLYTLWRHKP